MIIEASVALASKKRGSGKDATSEKDENNVPHIQPHRVCLSAFQVRAYMSPSRGYYE
jgi:hypothetical protein